MLDSYKILLSKGAKYCAEQERCKSEVRKKLLFWKATKEESIQIIEELEKQNFICEKRFVSAYCIGKFRQLGWGRIKIRAGLKQLGISPTLIGAGLQEIPEKDYRSLLAKTAEKRGLSKLKDEDFEAKVKIFRHLLSKGFEPELVKTALDLD